MPVMYGPDGQKQWVWPWQEEERRLQGWTTDPPVPEPRQQRRPARPSPYFVSPLEEARQALEQVQEPARLAAAYGLGRRRSTTVTVGQPRWVGTDLSWRSVYEMRVTPDEGIEHATWRRYALDTTSVRGMALFIEPMDMLTETLPSSRELAGLPPEPKPDIGNALTGSPVSPKDIIPKDRPAEVPSTPTGLASDATIRAANVMQSLLRGALDREQARVALRRIGLPEAQITTMLSGPTFDTWSQDAQALIAMQRAGSSEFQVDQAAYAACVAGGGDPTFCMIIASFTAEDTTASGGGYGPRYDAPDVNLVRDSVRGVLIALLGEADPGRIEAGVNLYMSNDRRAFYGAAVDPSESVRLQIRGYDEYKRRHALRPDNIDETDWIPAQASKLMSAGVRASAVDERAMIQAQVGVTPARAGEAAFISEFQQTSRPLPEFFQRFKNAAASSFRRVA